MNLSNDSKPNTPSLAPDPALAGYATALAELAGTAGGVETVERELAQVLDLLDRSGEICDFLTNPQVPEKAQRAALEDLLRGRISPMLLHWLLILFEQGAWRRLRETAEAFYVLAGVRSEVAAAEVTAAVPLTPGQVASIEQAVGAWLGRPVRLRLRVDRSVIGGVAVRVGNRIIDGTVAHRLEGMREALLGL
jgi:F-type H+-transporting ATPase subunit delta